MAICQERPTFMVWQEFRNRPGFTYATTVRPWTEVELNSNDRAFRVQAFC